MAKQCSEPGCGKKVVARGLCSQHYQQLRRAEGPVKGDVGRPREYPKELSDKHQGAPRLSVRLEPELLEWVRDQGGSTWLRHLAHELRELTDDPDFDFWWQRLRLQE